MKKSAVVFLTLSSVFLFACSSDENLGAAKSDAGVAPDAAVNVSPDVAPVTVTQTVTVTETSTGTGTSADAGPTCLENEVKLCNCGNGQAGVMTCKSNAFGDCECPKMDGGAGIDTYVPDAGQNPDGPSVIVIEMDCDPRKPGRLIAMEPCYMAEKGAWGDGYICDVKDGVGKALCVKFPPTTVTSTMTDTSTATATSTDTFTMTDTTTDTSTVTTTSTSTSTDVRDPCVGKKSGELIEKVSLCYMGNGWGDAYVCLQTADSAGLEAVCVKQQTTSTTTSTSTSTSTSVGTGGSSGTGGTTGTGGSTSTGGNTGSGGSTATGGSSGTGGSTGSGGATATGGSTGSGGTTETGGTTGTGGSTASGGSTGTGGSTVADGGADSMPPDAGDKPVVSCVVSAENSSLVNVTFNGYLDRSLNPADPAGSIDTSGLLRFCLVGDFDGWSSRSYCYDWADGYQSLTFWNIPVRTPVSSSRINFVKDNGTGTQWWIDDSRVGVTGRCANLPGLNLVVQ